MDASLQRDSLLLVNVPSRAFGGMVVCDSSGVEKFQTSEIINRVIQGDALKVLGKIEPEIFDMVFIDPPYYLQLPRKRLLRWRVRTIVEGVDEKWDRFSSFEEYDTFIERLLIEVRRVMKPSATIWVIGTYHNIFRIGKIMQDLGYWILNDVIWLKANPMPNWLGVRFTNSTETLIWAVKSKDVKNYTFNKEHAKKFGMGKVGANIWCIPICSGKERLRDEEGKKIHPTQKPAELLRRVILTSTKEEDLILDPLAGTGTTGYVARTLRRNFVMIESNERYVAAILERFRKPSITFEKR